MKCKKCGVDGNFTWDQQHFENSGNGGFLILTWKDHMIAMK